MTPSGDQWPPADRDGPAADLAGNPGVIATTMLSGVIAVAVAAAEWVGSGQGLDSPAGILWSVVALLGVVAMLLGAGLELRRRRQVAAPRAVAATGPAADRPAPPARAQIPELPTGTVTFLFTDIEGSTRLLQQLGGRYPAVRDEHAAILRRAIRDRDGVEVSTEGDSFFAAFASPVAAVGAAVAAQRGLAAHPWPEGFAVRVRTGLHRRGGAGWGQLRRHRRQPGGPDRRDGPRRPGDRLRCHPRPGRARRPRGDLRTRPRRAPAQGPQPPDAPVRPGDRGTPGRLPPTPDPGRPAGQPPRQLTSFVGRPRETDEARRLPGRTRLLTLTGAGGTGKSRLALQVAAELLPGYRDGAFFADLSSVTDPDLVPAVLARALRVPEAPGRPVLEALRDHLRDRRLLLVADNFEQVRQAGAVVEELLAATPGLTVLATSRVALSLRGSRSWWRRAGPARPGTAPDPEPLAGPTRSGGSSSGPRRCGPASS
jgi:hypothetical protein